MQPPDPNNRPTDARPPDVPDVLPEAANHILALCWLTLFAGRWLGGPLLLTTGLLSPDLLERLDEGLLLPLYVVLLVVTLAVLALRAVRGAQARVAPGASPPARRAKRRD